MSMEKANQVTAAAIIKNMEKRNFSGVYCATKEEALQKALSYIEKRLCCFMGRFHECSRDRAYRCREKFRSV